MAFVACTQNDVEELTANRATLPETLTVGFEGGDTRVELNDALKTVWTEGDEVSVFYQSYENTRWAFQGTTGDRSGELKLVSGEITEQTMDNIIVAYPYDANYRIDIEDKALHASLPAVQSYKEGSYGAEGNIMVAESDYRQFTLKSVVGWLRVELTGEGEVVESVKVRGNDGEQVAGLVYINAADASIALAGSEVEESLVATEVVLNCGDGVELGAEATEFYVALLPQTFEKGMTVEVDYSNGNSQTLVCENNVTIRRNHISPINIEASEEEDVVNSQIFYTATALVEPNNTSAFNVAIVSNEWNEATGEGVITFDGELTTIGSWAFSDCRSLRSVTIPDSVTTIGDQAFRNCISLTSVTIPDSVTTIGNNAFDWCYRLTSVTIPDSVTTIGDLAFYGCSSLTSVTIGDGVTTIGDEAFSGCYSLTSVTIPDSVTTIGKAAFASCSLIEFKGKFAADGGRCLIKDNTLIAYAEASGTTYTIPDSVTTIGKAAFGGCSSLRSVTIPDSVTTIGDQAFRNCISLTSVTIPDSVTTIGDRAFYYCGLRSVTIPDSVTTIGGRAFYDCDSLTSVTIGDSVTTIGGSAFSDCDSLTSVTIPDSVTTIGDHAFYGCSRLTSVYCKATTPPAGGSEMFSSFDTIYIPEGSLRAYKMAEYWSDYADCFVEYDYNYNSTVTISYTTSDGMPVDAHAPIVSNSYQNGVGELTYIGKDMIPAGLFFECDNLTSVTIPDSVTTIGDSAFNSCVSLTSVTIPDSVMTIGNGVFAGCSNLTSVTIGDSVTTIGSSAFYLCTSLTSVTIPDSVTTIGDYAFYWCDSLTTVTIGDSVTSIGDEAFYECRSLTSVTIPDSVTSIGDEAFYFCTSLTSVYCEATTPPTLGRYVFAYGTSGRKIYVPAESVEAYKAAGWSIYASYIVGYNFETGEVVE